MQDDSGSGERPADNPPPLLGETQRMPETPPGSPAPWATEPARREEPAPAPYSPPAGGETTALGSEMPRGPSPYGPPPPAAPAPPPYSPPPVYAPPVPYTPPSAYGPQPNIGGSGFPAGSGGYGAYGAPPMVAPSNGTALGALVCGILAIVLGCSAGPLGAILGGVALILVRQYTTQQRTQPGLVPSPSDATYVQVGRVTAYIGLAIGLLYTVLIGCYFIFIFAAIAGGLGSTAP